MNFVVMCGSVRSDRQGIKAAHYVRRGFEARGHAVTLVDPMHEHRLPLLDRMYKEYPAGQAPSVLQKLAELYRNADGFVVVSGEYNHTVQPALINLLDHFLEEYFFRPSAIVSYSAGAYGGVRAAMQLRATLAELGMSSIPSIFPVPRIGKAIAEDGAPLDESLNKRFLRFAAEFEWYAHALHEARLKGTPY
jgi:NAD(P)H-dependent FMN reductase